MGAHRHGQGERFAAPWKCCKVLFVLQVLSKVSVHEVFLHYFEKMSSAFGGFHPQTPIMALPQYPAGGLTSQKLHNYCCYILFLCW